MHKLEEIKNKQICIHERLAACFHLTSEQTYNSIQFI